jgi:hypothetical protein
MLDYSYRVVEYDAETPWIVAGVRQLVASLAEGVDFREWTAQQWAAPRYDVELLPGQVARVFGA